MNEVEGEHGQHAGQQRAQAQSGTSTGLLVSVRTASAGHKVSRHRMNRPADRSRTAKCGARRTDDQRRWGYSPCSFHDASGLPSRQIDPRLRRRRQTMRSWVRSGPAVIRSGPWSDEEIRRYLDATVIPVRLASMGTFPLVQSLWFLPDGLDLWCATQADSRAGPPPPRRRPLRLRGLGGPAALPRGARLRARGAASPRPPPTSCPGSWTATAVPDDSPLAAWLLSRMDTRSPCGSRPRTLASWDYSPRM